MHSSSFSARFFFLAVLRESTPSMIVCVWKSWSSDLGYPTIVVFACALEIPLHFEISVFQEKEENSLQCGIA